MLNVFLDTLWKMSGNGIFATTDKCMMNNACEQGAPESRPEIDQVTIYRNLVAAYFSGHLLLYSWGSPQTNDCVSVPFFAARCY